MDTSRDKTVRRFVRWLKDKVENRRGRDGDNDPWWVTLLLDIGRPLVAVMILTMCAPGEHYLAVQSGWSETLAWGMPGTLTAYAGIASVVATKRPKKAPGRKTAIAGAVVSVSLAMAAQPVAHLYGREGLTSQLIWLTVIMGIIPGAVFGHLLHMGASAPRPVRVPEDKGQDIPEAPVATVTPIRPRPVPSPVPAVPQPVSRPSVPAASNVLSLTKGTGTTAPPGQTAGQNTPSLSARALSLWQDGTDEDKIKEILRAEYVSPDGTPPKPNSVTKAVTRAKLSHPRP